MNDRAKELLEQVLALPADDREELVELAEVSLAEHRGDVEAAWTDEIVRRVNEIDAGLVQCREASEVMAEIRARRATRLR